MPDSPPTMPQNRKYLYRVVRGERVYYPRVACNLSAIAWYLGRMIMGIREDEPRPSAETLRLWLHETHGITDPMGTSWEIAARNGFVYGWNRDGVPETSDDKRTHP